MRGKGNVLRHFPMIPGRPRLCFGGGSSS